MGKRVMRGTVNDFVLRHIGVDPKVRGWKIKEAQRLLALAQSEGIDTTLLSIKTAIYRTQGPSKPCGKRTPKVKEGAVRAGRKTLANGLLSEVAAKLLLLTREVNRLQAIEARHGALVKAIMGVKA